MPGVFNLLQCAGSRPMSLIKGLSPSEKIKGFIGCVRPYGCLGFFKTLLWDVTIENKRDSVH